jgi:uncharacterized protein YbjT (DUF2867 family)
MIQGNARRQEIPMRVLVIGAYGLIGAACLARLHRDGHEVTGAGRAIAAARRRAPFAPWVEADFNALTLAGDWLPLLEGNDVVVNCVGVLQDGARDDIRRVHVEATAALFAACERASVRRVIHISALGASHQGPTPFSRSKAEAEDDLMGRTVEWAILRPGLVLAPAVYGGTAMLRGLAGLPFVTPVVEADAKVQVVSIDDLTETVSRCVAAEDELKVRWDVAHPQVIRLGTMVTSLRGWLGFPPRPLWRLSREAGSAIAAFADLLGFLGWRSPARSTALRQLAAGVTGDPAPWLAATGIAPKSFDDVLAQQPSSVADRWFARLYLFKPLAIAALALFWLATGVITLGPGRAAAMAHLSAAGFPEALAKPVLYLGAGFDYLLGVLLLVRAATRTVLYVMLAATVVYLALGSALAPQLWFDPLGPYLKIVPVLLASLFVLAILDER